GDGKVRRMAHRMCASSPKARGCAFGEPRRPLANPEHMDVLRTCSRGGLSLGHLSLATQRKVARPLGSGRKKTGTSNSTVRASARSRVRPTPIRPAGTFPRKRGKESSYASMRQAPDVRAQAAQLFLDVLVAAIDVVNAIDDGVA